MGDNVPSIKFGKVQWSLDSKQKGIDKKSATKVDPSITDTKKKKAQEALNNRLFDWLDQNKDGILDEGELKVLQVVIKDYSNGVSRGDNSMDADEVRQLLDHIQYDTKNGKINRDNLYSFLNNLNTANATDGIESAETKDGVTTVRTAEGYTKYKMVAEGGQNTKVDIEKQTIKDGIKTTTTFADDGKTVLSEVIEETNKPPVTTVYNRTAKPPVMEVYTGAVKTPSSKVVYELTADGKPGRPISEAHYDAASQTLVTDRAWSCDDEFATMSNHDGTYKKVYLNGDKTAGDKIKEQKVLKGGKLVVETFDYDEEEGTVTITRDDGTSGVYPWTSTTGDISWEKPSQTVEKDAEGHTVTTDFTYTNDEDKPVVRMQTVTDDENNVISRGEADENGKLIWKEMNPGSKTWWEIAKSEYNATTAAEIRAVVHALKDQYIEKGVIEDYNNATVGPKQAGGTKFQLLTEVHVGNKVITLKGVAPATPVEPVEPVAPAEELAAPAELALADLPEVVQNFKAPTTADMPKLPEDLPELPDDGSSVQHGGREYSKFWGYIVEVINTENGRAENEFAEESGELNYTEYYHEGVDDPYRTDSFQDGVYTGTTISENGYEIEYDEHGTMTSIIHNAEMDGKKVKTIYGSDRKPTKIEVTTPGQNGASDTKVTYVPDPNDPGKFVIKK